MVIERSIVTFIRKIANEGLIKRLGVISEQIFRLKEMNHALALPSVAISEKKETIYSLISTSP